jgi:hypothetical protein
MKMPPKNLGLRLIVGLSLVVVYYVLYYPARGAEKFSDWFNRWDIETFGW